MLSGKELGDAIAEAIKKKGVSKAAVARHFGVKPPSIQDWIKRGVINKDKLERLWAYFANVAGPQHWGMDSFPNGQPTVRGVESPTPPHYGPTAPAMELRTALDVLDEHLRRATPTVRDELQLVFPPYIRNPARYAHLREQVFELLSGEETSSRSRSGNGR